MVDDDERWATLAELVRYDMAEGKRTGHRDLGGDFIKSMIANYRAKAPDYRFHLTLMNGAAVAHGAMARAPNNMDMIEDLFTQQQCRRRGIASALIAYFDRELRAAGCDAVFLGAMAEEAAKLLYYNLGFRPAMLTRCWVKKAGT
ncbi:MAG TPA: GNAT family N-acetyltransferase [Acetobacteraceae bacterium]|nr:GNAT family N-acetyltransferase [Acetobacteraceae bacterium]